MKIIGDLLGDLNSDYLGIQWDLYINDYWDLFLWLFFGII